MLREKKSKVIQYNETLLYYICNFLYISFLHSLPFVSRDSTQILQVMCSHILLYTYTLFSFLLFFPHLHNTHIYIRIYILLLSNIKMPTRKSLFRVKFTPFAFTFFCSYILQVLSWWSLLLLACLSWTFAHSILLYNDSHSQAEWLNCFCCCGLCLLLR